MKTFDELKQELAPEVAGLRPDTPDLPLGAKMVPLILVTRSQILFGCLPYQKRQLTALYTALCKSKRLKRQEQPRLLACWPGQWSSHVFEIDPAVDYRQNLHDPHGLRTRL